jgi:putative membrane protein
MTKSSPVSWLINGLKGMFIGIANAIPGVSGGTIAVITGIYEPLIGAFGAVSDGIASVFTKNREWKGRIASALPILIPVVIGLAIGLVGFANVIEALSERIPMQTQFLFIGLILGSLPFLIKQSGKTAFRWTYLIPLVLGTALLVWMAVVNFRMGSRDSLIAAQDVIRTVTPVNALVLIFVGMIAVGTMVIPGVSGSFLMLLIGMYATFIKMFTEGNLPIIALFMVGALLGLLIVSKIIAWLLERFHGHAYFGIVGLVLGSAAVLWPGFSFDINGWTSIGAFVLGFAAAFFLGSDRKNRPSAPAAAEGEA